MHSTWLKVLSPIIALAVRYFILLTSLCFCRRCFCLTEKFCETGRVLFVVVVVADFFCDFVFFFFACKCMFGTCLLSMSLLNVKFKQISACRFAVCYCMPKLRNIKWVRRTHVSTIIIGWLVGLRSVVGCRALVAIIPCFVQGQKQT